MESQFKIQPLKLETMCDLDDGIFKAALDQALESAGNDLSDRPGLKGARKVSVELTFKPIMDQTGMCTDVVAEYEIKTNLPSNKSRAINMGLKPSGQMMFRGASPDNHAQQHLPLEQTDYSPDQEDSHDAE